MEYQCEHESNLKGVKVNTFSAVQSIASHARITSRVIISKL